VRESVMRYDRVTPLVKWMPALIGEVNCRVQLRFHSISHINNGMHDFKGFHATE
jgi:hypothetical protein